MNHTHWNNATAKKEEEEEEDEGIKPRQKTPYAILPLVLLNSFLPAHNLPAFDGLHAESIRHIPRFSISQKSMKTMSSWNGSCSILFRGILF